MKIIVYGPGCHRCHETERIVREALRGLGLEADVQKVSDYQAMAKAGVLATPAVAVDGVLKVAGRIPQVTEVCGWLAPARG